MFLLDIGTLDQNITTYSVDLEIMISGIMLQLTRRSDGERS